MPGPPKTPVELALLRGNPGKRKVNRARPRPSGAPAKPDDLSVRAAELWDGIVRDYEHTGVLTGVDAGVLRVYVEAVSRYEVSARLLAESGPVVKGSRGNEVIRNPVAIVARDDADLVIRSARELGFTPAARSALTPLAGGPSEEDALSSWERRSRRSSG